MALARRLRRFTPGFTATISGVTFRVKVGRKEPGDQVIQWSTPDGYRDVKMAALALLVDFWVENEDVLREYRPHWRMTAKEKLFSTLNIAVDSGWQVAAAQLEDEKLGAVARRDSQTGADRVTADIDIEEVWKEIGW